MNTYEIRTTKTDRTARVEVVGPEDRRAFRATVRFATLEGMTGPRRAQVSWPSIGAVKPELAEAVGNALRTAARLAEASDRQPLGLAPKYTGSVETKVRVDTPEAAELCAEHEARAATREVREEARAGVFFLYHGATWDWDLGEPVYNLGLGARVLYRVPESKMTPTTEVTA